MRNKKTIKRNTKKRKNSKRKKRKSKSKDLKIIDIPFSKKQSEGTNATLGSIQLHYQKYSNIIDYLNKLNNPSICFFDQSFLNLKISDMEMSIFPLDEDKESFKEKIFKCIKSKQRFIPIILNLITDEGNHANILLIDKKDKLIELYEPHGSRSDKSVLGGIKGAYIKKINEVKKFWKNILPTFEVKNIVDLKEGTNFQLKYDPDNHSGFCVTWSLLFIHYRILNPNIQLEKLIKYISKHITTRKLLQYAKYIEDNIKNKI